MSVPAPRPSRSASFESLTVPEVAGILGVSAMTVYRLIHDDELLAHRIGRSIRVNRRDLDAYLDEAEGPATQRWAKHGP